MNINAIQTRAQLDSYGQEFLVVDITDNPLTGNKRKAAILNNNNDLMGKEVLLNVGVFELDAEGEIIHSRTIKPYELGLIAKNSNKVDPQTGLNSEEENAIGEFDFFVAATKAGANVWSLFAGAIMNSTILNDNG